MLNWFFETAQFMPHGYCLIWRPDLVAMHGVSDAVTALSYFSIPIAIYYVMTKRGDVEFGPVPALFVAFILLCGLNHIASLVTLVYPAYGAQAMIKIAMAVVSFVTAIVIWPLVPKMLAIPSISALREKNEELEAALAEKDALVADLQAARDTLDARHRMSVEVIEQVAGGLSVLNEGGSEILSNRAFRDFAERPIVAQAVADAVEAAQAEADPAEAEPASTGAPQRVTVGSGETRLELEISARRIFAGARRKTLVEIIDVTDEAHAKTALARSERLLWEAIDAIPDGFAMFDGEGRLVVANDAYRDFHRQIADEIRPGVGRDRLLERCLETGLYRFDEDEADEWMEMAQRVAHDDVDRSSVLELGDGRWMQRNERRLDTGELVGLCVDVTTIKRREAEMRAARDQAAEAMRANEEANARAEFEAMHDPLTGLANRRHLFRRLEAIVEDGRAEQFAVICIDLDRFKPINDTHGHPAGDFVLQNVAVGLRLELRGSDFVARFGGDEFVAVVDLGEAGRDAENICARLLERISQPVDYQGRQLRVGGSIGYAVGRAEDATADAILSNADLALYKAKHDGRNRVEAFTPGLASRARERLALSEEFKGAIDAAAFEPYFQPQFDAQTGALCGFEALARWPHPTRGLLTPGTFLDIAFENKLAGALDRIILDKALETFAALKAEGLPAPRVSVNVSTRRLQDPELIEELRARDDLPSEGLAFEVLETVFVDAADAALLQTIEAVKEMGVEIELDDFGSGHASVAGILALRPHRLKLDRMFSVGIAEDPERRAVLRSLLGVAASVGVPVTAEGVETEAQAEVLRAEGAAALQGFGLARPMPAEALLDWLRARHGAADVA